MKIPIIKMVVKSPDEIEATLIEGELDGICFTEEMRNKCNTEIEVVFPKKEKDEDHTMVRDMSDDDWFWHVDWLKEVV